MSQATPEDVILALLDAQWNTSNTDSKKPTIEISSELSVSKRPDLANRDGQIYVFERNRQNIKNSTGSLSKRQVYNGSLKILVGRSNGRTYFTKILGEAERILDANIVRPAAGYSILDPSGTYPLSNNRTKGFWVVTMDYKLIQDNVVRNA